MEAVTQIPKYTKFLNDILSNKRNWDAHETIPLNEEYSDVIRNKLPPKLKDLGSITIPYVVGKFFISKALYDLGASVTIMPLSLCRKLNIREPKSINISLQLADRSIIYPEGVLEDIPIKVGEFYVHCDIVILEMEEDSHIPIILGRPFLATEGAIIDVKCSKIKIEIGEETVEFDIFQMTRDPSLMKTCFKVNTI